MLVFSFADVGNLQVVLVRNILCIHFHQPSNHAVLRTKIIQHGRVYLNVVRVILHATHAQQAL